MLWEIPVFALIGLFVGLAAPRFSPHHFGDRPRMAALTGAAGALIGGTVMHGVLGGGPVGYELLGSGVMAVTLVAVAARPDTKGAHRRQGRA